MGRRGRFEKGMGARGTDQIGHESPSGARRRTENDGSDYARDIGAKLFAKGNPSLAIRHAQLVPTSTNFSTGSFVSAPCFPAKFFQPRFNDALRIRSG